LTHPVTLRIGRQNGPLGPPMPTAIHADGPEPSYALTTYSFPSAGVYQLSATYQGSSVTLPISVIDPSSTRVPVVGQALPSVATPTVAQPIGVNPVCTANPPCPFHSVSLDAALAARRPIALLFATPALCQSRYCGPVLLNLQAVAGPWLNRVTFIHCEIYTDLSGQTSVPAVTAYHLEHEPLLFLAGPDGIVRERLDNGYDQVEAVSALQRLVA
jgi:hypothetical protein